MESNWAGFNPGVARHRLPADPKGGHKMRAPHNRIGTLGEELTRIAADLDRRDRRLPRPLPDAFVARLIVTLLENAAEFRPVLWRVLRRGRP